MPSKQNVADILAMGLGGPLHNYLANLMEINLGIEDSVAKEKCFNTVSSSTNWD